MPSDFAEEAVLRYLQKDRSLFLRTQYQINDGAWTATPDFLAINFETRIIWMVEVSIAPIRKLSSKIAEFEKDYIHRIESQLYADQVIHKISHGLPDWKVKLWVFGRSDYRIRIERMAEQAKIKDRFLYTDLETVVRYGIGLWD